MPLAPTQAQAISRWTEHLEREGCEVARSRGRAGRLEVRVPAWERTWLPEVNELPVALEQASRWFAERLVLEVAEGGHASFRPDYLSPLQLAFHGAIAAMFAWDAWFGELAQGALAVDASPWRPLALLAMVQALPVGLAQLSAAWSARRLTPVSPAAGRATGSS